MILGYRAAMKLQQIRHTAESTETSFILLINFKDNCFDSMRLASDKI